MLGLQQLAPSPAAANTSCGSLTYVNDPPIYYARYCPIWTSAPVVEGTYYTTLDTFGPLAGPIISNVIVLAFRIHTPVTHRAIGRTQRLTTDKLDGYLLSTFPVKTISGMV